MRICESGRVAPCLHTHTSALTHTRPRPSSRLFRYIVVYFIRRYALPRGEPFDSVLTRTFYETTTIQCSSAVIIIHIGIASSYENSDAVNKFAILLAGNNRSFFFFNIFFYASLACRSPVSPRILIAVNHSLFLPRNVC